MAPDTPLPAVVIPYDALLEHWRGHRRVTRRMIQAFPDDALFGFSIGGMRPFSAMALEMIRMASAGVRGLATFEPVRGEQKRLDVLAIVMTGQPASWKSFLDDSPSAGRAFVESWIWPHIVTAWHAAKLMVTNRSGLIVELVEQDNVEYHGAFYFDVMETLLKRLVFGLANDLGSHGVTAVAVAPGFMRTEAILDGFGVTEATWRDALESPQAAAMGWGGSETPCFVGRAVAALAADPAVARKNGGIYTTRLLSEEYGFTDVDGTHPDYAVLAAAIEQAKRTFLAPMLKASESVPVNWKLTSKAESPS